MKKFILASATLLALVGCESSTSSNDTALKCNVTRSANSVKIVESMMGGAYYYESTVTVKLGNDGYYYSEIVSKETVPDAGAAAENCAEEREEATHWLDGSYQVQCYGNTVETHEVSSDADLDKREEEFNYLCKISERAGEEGLEDYEDWD